MSLLLLLDPHSERAEVWEQGLKAALPDETIEVYPHLCDPAQVEVAIVANPPAGVLAELPKLQLIQSLWAGVDRLLADPTLPHHVPLCRLVDPNLNAAMSESVLLHVLTLHRRVPQYRAQQTRRQWKQWPQPLAAETTTGILGLGELGRTAALALSRLGFRVLGWSRGPKVVEGITVFSGSDGLNLMLGQTQILVNLLPLTDHTQGMLNHDLFTRLPQGASLINLARGKHLVEEDILEALGSGQLSHAILDVFATEPLPEAHPFWSHPQISVLPHVAAYSNPQSSLGVVKENLSRLRSGQPLLFRVDTKLGY